MFETTSTVAGIKDPAVYELATAQDRILITFNGHHFRRLIGTLPHSSGVIALPPDWTTAQIDTKLSALLMNHSPAYFQGQYRTLATE